MKEKSKSSSQDTAKPEYEIELVKGKVWKPNENKKPETPNVGLNKKPSKNKKYFLFSSFFSVKMAFNQQSPNTVT